eukprot:m.42645 g.42645  ORF g.42645 m.42645 type:complete len:72 (+) comp10721_c1_seq1:355-570(+)
MSSYDSFCDGARSFDGIMEPSEVPERHLRPKPQPLRRKKERVHFKKKGHGRHNWGHWSDSVAATLDDFAVN